MKLPYGLILKIDYLTQKTMTNTIRVKKENAVKVLEAIPGSKQVAAPPYENPVWDDDEPSLLPATGMVGIELPAGMSGSNAHKIIAAL